MGGGASSSRRGDPREAFVVGFVQIEKCLVGLNRPGRENDPFEYEVRPILDENAVLETARLVFAGVADDVARTRRALRRHAPFSAHGKSRPAAAAQSGRLNFREDIARNRR